ncbi:MAG: hypothetical protein HRT89_06940 [Lentisphaeria bacterium]|nr:lipopolysaccharide kinase InaA family protein [Lentisphaeria bacterium]NQZ67789.1 hypothetical protein [Lentisphaeria bacterium]
MTKKFTKNIDYVRSYPALSIKRMRKSKPKREYDNYLYMKKIGIPCPENITMNQQRNKIGLLVEAKLEMDFVKDTKDLRHFFFDESLKSFHEDLPFRLKTARLLGGYIKQMHDNGYFHLNLNFRNILIRYDSDTAPELFFIDCTSGLRRPKFKIKYYICKEIAFMYKDARKWCGIKELLAFMHVYTGRNKLTTEDRAFMKRIVSYAGNKWGDRSSTLQD